MQTLCDRFEVRGDRWAIVTEFAAEFLRPFRPADSVAGYEVADCERSLGRQLPEALVEFYALCGNAKDLWCRQDEWLEPARLRWADGILVFWVENQGNWQIGLRQSDFGLEDPPVVWDGASWTYGRGKHGEYTVLCESVSKFALNMIAYVGKFFNGSREQPFGFTSDIDRMVEVLGGHYARCELQEEWVCGPVKYFQDSEAFVEVCVSDGFIYPIFKTSAAVSRFCALADRTPFQWERAPAGR